MPSLSVLEAPTSAIDALWIRGGFPDSFLAPGDRQSLHWRRDLLRTYLERDVPMFGSRIPAETLRRFWTMLAHNQGALHNASRLAAGLEVSGQSVGRYTDLLVDLLLVRRLQPYHYRQSERERDPEQADSDAGESRRKDGATAASEDDPEGTDELRRQLANLKTFQQEWTSSIAIKQRASNPHPRDTTHLSRHFRAQTLPSAGIDFLCRKPLHRHDAFFRRS